MKSVKKPAIVIKSGVKAGINGPKEPLLVSQSLLINGPKEI
jgi:hypothetical protein